MPEDEGWQPDYEDDENIDERSEWGNVYENPTLLDDGNPDND